MTRSASSARPSAVGVADPIETRLDPIVGLGMQAAFHGPP